MLIDRLAVGSDEAHGVCEGRCGDPKMGITSKSIAFEGILTPEREDASDGAAGRGFFLWADKAQSLNPQGKPVPYSFNGSYDFLLLTAPVVE